jgi:hypothetical protein
VGWIVTLNTLTKVEAPPAEPVNAISDAPAEAAA